MEREIKYLITRGDDCGCNDTANRGIMEAYRNGIMCNVSLMAPCESIEKAAQELAGIGELCFGLHSTMNAEWDLVRWGPVSPVPEVPSLVDERGHFYQTEAELQRSGAQVDEAIRELDAQFARLRKLGFRITYADQHMSFGKQIEGFEERFEAWCEAAGLINFAKLPAQRLPEVDAAGLDPVEKLIGQLEAAEPGLYKLIGHPAYDNEEMRRLGHLGYPGDIVATERDWERRLFSDPRVLRYCALKGVRPIRVDEAASLFL